MAAVAQKESRAILGALRILVVVVMIASTAIVSGDVEVDLPDGATHLGPGHFFGEVALIEQTNRQATVTSPTDCQLMRLPGARRTQADRFGQIYSKGTGSAKQMADGIGGR